MKRIAIVAVMVMMSATAAQAIDSGQGGYIYWSATDAVDNPPAATRFNLYRLDITTTWGVASAGAIFDCIPFSNSYGQFSTTMNNNLEVYDPRDQGGTGSILHSTILPGYPGSSWSQPWQIIKEDPTTHVQTNLCDGASSGWNSYLLGKVLVAPANWQGYSTNGLSLAGGPSYFINRVYALHDADSSGKIDDAGAEAANLGGTDYRYDQEMGKDGALYWTTGGDLRRLSSTGTMTTFYTVGGTVGFVDGRGIAVGKGASNPIVYLAGNDSSGTVSIFALRDLVGNDGVADCVTKVWKNGDFSTSTSNNGYGMEDIEYYVNPETGKQFIIFNSYYNTDGLYVVELADNGLASVAAKNITSGGALPGGYNSGFEIDMNPVAGVPEPATLMLLGTGALGAISWMRRRRVQ